MFKQTETKYKSIKMGFGTGSIYSFGCYLVSVCNALQVKGYSYTPESLNELFKEKKLWIGEFKNYIDVDNLYKVLPDIFTSFTKKEPFTDTQLKQYMDLGLSVVAKVDAKAIGGTGTHFVLVTKYDGKVATIFDPWFGDEQLVTKRYGKLGNLLGLRVFNIKKFSNNMITPSEKLPKEFYEIREFKQLKERKLVEGTETFDTLMALLLAENTHRNDAVNELQKQINLFEEQKKGWEETKKEALESQKKEFENKIYGMSETIADLQLQVQDKPVVSNTLPKSAKWNFNTKDLVAWLKNIGLFGLLPLVITLLASFTGEIPTNTIYGVIGLALLNALIDFIKKLLKDNEVEK